MNAESSWHPAFMPNSKAELITKAAILPSNPAREPLLEPAKPISPPSPSHPVAPELKQDARVGSNEGSVEEGNEGHAELDNLRDALTTSLASPGGVELEQNPVSNNTLDNGTSNMDIDFTPEEKADFPSEGPTPPANKHLSTMSFARTVSQEVNWGEDDEVDPEWNLQRTDTDHFKSMPKSDRTNSFPQVPPAHTPVLGFKSHNQASEIIIDAEQEPRDLFGDDDHSREVDFFAQQLVDEQEAHEVPIHDKQSDYGQTFGGDVQHEEDEESQARFEEGIPLVPDECQQASESFSAFEDDGYGEDDFFTQASKLDQQNVASAPHPLERKSTMQVIDSLHFQPHEQNHDSIPEEDYITSSQSSLDKATGGGIAASTSTIVSQVLGDPSDPIHQQPEILASLGMESGEDLAAKWKAALAEDEFLDDDNELLPDDEPVPVEGKAMDPADIFGSDDEGFLEDNDDQRAAKNLFPQQTSHPVPAPVPGANGQTIGFDSLTRAAQRPGSSGSRPGSSSRYIPDGVQTLIPPPGSQYAPTAPLFTDLSRPGTAGAQPSPYTSPAIQNFPNQLPPQQRPEVQKAESFAAKSKGGYHSPYDLPMDVAKPRKRVSMQTLNRGYNQSVPQVPLAPPRSSSMYTQPPPPSRGSTSSLSPPTSSHSFQPSQLQNQPPASTHKPLPSLKSKASFFEELPLSARPKAAPRHPSGQSTQSYTPPPPPPQHPPSGGYEPPPQQQPLSQPPYPVQGLVAPERVSPYAALSSNTVPPPTIASRYSPAPPQPHIQAGPPPPVAQSRYSPAPPPQVRQANSYSAPPVGAPPPPILPHQPRTSSPLAHFSQDSRSSNPQYPASFDRRTSSSYESSLKPHHLPPTREVDETEQYGNNPEISNQHGPPLNSRQSQTPPPPQNIASRIVNSPPKRATSSNYLPQQASGRPTASQTFAPPQRSQTQSPGTAYTGPKLDTGSSDPYQRPASVELPTSPRAPSGYSSISNTSTRPRGFSQGLSYIVPPPDARGPDPMERWKGSPVFAWGVGGTLITSFPKDVPRYGMNQVTPMILRSPGEVKIRNIKDIDPLPERLTGFPGPLKGKSKKKEVVAWLTSGIQILEHNASYLRTARTLTHEDKRIEERILLWKILQVFVEHDGTLEGNPAVEKAVRAVLSPGLDEEASGLAPLYATGAELSGISQSSASIARADPVDPSTLDHLRKLLLRGDREKAVWDAVDKRLWAHAMLISNTVSNDLYKQVASEFVRKEVKEIGDNTESLAVLYQIFAGNFEESIEGLVPLSARAGFQMISKSNAAGPTKDALDGLDRWRETLSLVLSNRSIEDNQALNALGKLLSGYGRAEAAHICFLFARSHSVFGGIDDPAASFVLLGADHLRQPHEFGKEIEPILLSEVFEYGMSLSNTSNVSTSAPHLSIYKLQHALTLAEYGYREKALQYCDAIAGPITAQTRRSPYHHASLVAELDDLHKRLKQSPKDEKSSWISKPSVDKVSSSVWSSFNKFVAGEESDTGTPGSAAGSGTDVGPFARIAGGTPTISRSPSNSDLYGSYNGGLGINGTLAQASKNSSRYAPGGSYTPPADQQTFQPGTSYGSQPRSSFEGRSSGEHRRGPYEPIRRDSDYRPGSQPIANNYTPQSSSALTPQSSTYTPYTPYGTDSPQAETESPYAPQPPVLVNDQPPSAYSSHHPGNAYQGNQTSAYMPPESSYQPPPFSDHESPNSGYEPPSSSYEPPSSNYEPPSSGYSPPSYEPTTMNDELESPVDTRPKKKSFMDDDDDDYPQRQSTPGTGEKTKEEKDREAEEAFRKAAEADAARAKEAAPAKKGWGLGGWFGGGKKESTEMAAQPNKPIRAKLGEESSFVYDPQLKRWINKKGGTESTPTPTATPPPPRASGPPRAASGTGPPGPTSAPRMGTPPRTPPTSFDPPASAPPAARGLAAPPAMIRSVSNGSAGSGTITGPPSRPGTSMSNASSIDDLLGPPSLGGRKGTARGKKKGRGYIDVMGEKPAGT